MGHKQRVRHPLVEADLVVLPPGEPEILLHLLISSLDCAWPILRQKRSYVRFWIPYPRHRR